MVNWPTTIFEQRKKHIRMTRKKIIYRLVQDGDGYGTSKRKISNIL